MTKSVKVSLIVVILLSATVLFAVANLSGNSLYYFTVDEYVARNDLGNRFVQVKGKVVPGSIRYDAVALDLSFDLQEKDKQVRVLYHGLKPDALNDGIEVVAAGRADGDVFRARDLTVKCPSRYISAEQQKGGEHPDAGSGR